MLLAYHRSLLDGLRTPTPTDPLRVLLSGCLAAWPCGVDGTDYGLGIVLADLLRLPTLRALPFCPEQHSLGTPRTMPDIHGGDGVDVLVGRARVLDERQRDLSVAMIEGARAMLAFAQRERAELAILTDMSAACGSQVISDGCRLVPARRYQKGVGVATALLLEAGLLVVSQRDHRTLSLLRARLDPSHVPPGELLDHHQHPLDPGAPAAAAPTLLRAGGRGASRVGRWGERRRVGVATVATSGAGLWRRWGRRQHQRLRFARTCMCRARFSCRAALVRREPAANSRVMRRPSLTMRCKMANRRRCGRWT